jgi:hypothetical protein
LGEAMMAEKVSMHEKRKGRGRETPSLFVPCIVMGEIERIVRERG